ncbi:MAG: GNAT family N-acetyltransferase [Litoreibacter sp.]
MIVERADPRDAQTSALLRQSHDLMQELFPPEENYFLDIEELCAPSIQFFVTKVEDVTIGTAALSIMDGYGELKSMFVDPARRGSGAADALIQAVEAAAVSENLPFLRLETATSLAAAVKLYTRHGFSTCSLFGDYTPNNTSLFMEKALAPSE